MDKNAKVTSGVYRGRGVGRGRVAGVSRLLHRELALDILEKSRIGDGGAILPVTFESLVEKTVRQLEASRARLGERLPEAATLLFDSHLTMLNDPMFRGRVHDELRAGSRLDKAIAETAVAFIQFFESSPHEFLREKAQDIEDIAIRLIGNLAPDKQGASPSENESAIIVAQELLPSDIVRIAQTRARAIILTNGGLTGHVSLLVRSLGIPLVIVNTPGFLLLEDGTPLVVDGPEGTVTVNPTEAEIREIELGAAAGARQFAGAEPRRGTKTRDGETVRLMANINLLNEVGDALAAQAEGVGLYRTENLFLMHKDIPSEDEQRAIYRGMLERMGPDRPVVFRTLDVGGDKVLSYFDDPPESNPALGLRSTRFTLRHPEIFDSQMRAILRAAGSRETTGVMFPMIGSIDEWRKARARFDACAAQVEGETGVANRVRLGVMVEIPSVVEIAADLAKEAAFFSIGTNDFIQYALGADRTNESVADYYCPHHPSVLRGLKRIADAAIAAGIPVSVCGEMAHDPRYVPFLLGIGIRILSIDPSYLPAIREQIAGIDTKEAAAYAASLLAEPTIAGVEALLRCIGAPAGAGAR